MARSNETLNMKRAYYYFFYKIYKSIEYTSEAMGGKFWSKGKAGISVVVLELWLLFSILNYYDIINNSKQKLDLTSPVIFIPLLIIIILNYVIFDHYDSVWEKYKKEFDILSKRKNIIGGIIVWAVILLITVNFFVSTHYFYKTFFTK